MKLNFGQPDISFDTNIIDIKVPEKMKHAVPTGHQYIDLLFAGDGVLPSTVALVTGAPGSGKSTLLQQVADCITGSGNIVLYNALEEHLVQVARRAEQLGFKHGFIPAYHDNVDELIQHLELLREAYPDKQLFLVLDSIACISPSKVDPETGEKKRGRPVGGLNAQVEATTALVSWAKSNYAIIFLIGHVTKEGVAAGKQELKHLIDAHLHLGFDVSRRSDTFGLRVAEMEKNRFGIANTKYCFDIFADGIKFNQPSVAIAEEYEEEVENSVITLPAISIKPKISNKIAQKVTSIEEELDNALKDFNLVESKII